MRMRIRIGISVLLALISTRCIGENIDASKQELRRLVQSVLTNNFDLQIKEQRVSITQLNKNISHEEFFPYVGLGMFYQDSNDPVRTIYGGSLTGSVRNQASWIEPYIGWQSPYLGTHLKLSFLSKHETSDNTTYLFRPYYRTRFSATLTQPLLKDLWINRKLKRIKDEKINLKIEKQSQITSQLDTIFRLEQNYWTLNKLYIKKALLSELKSKSQNIQEDIISTSKNTQKQHLLDISKFYNNDQPNSYILTSIRFRQNEIKNIINKLNSDNDNIRNLDGFLDNLKTKTQRSIKLQNKIKSINSNYILITQLNQILALFEATDSKNYQEQFKLVQKSLSSQQLLEAINNYPDQNLFSIKGDVKQFLKIYSLKTLNTEQVVLNQLKNSNQDLLDYEVQALVKELINTLEDNDNILLLPRIAKLRTLKYNIERLIQNNTSQKKLLSIIRAFNPKNRQEKMIIEIANLVEGLPATSKYSSKDIKNKLLNLQSKIAKDLNDFSLLEKISKNIYQEIDSQYINLHENESNKDNEKRWSYDDEKKDENKETPAMTEQNLRALYKSNFEYSQYKLINLKEKLEAIQMITNQHPNYNLSIKKNDINPRVEYNILISSINTPSLAKNNTIIYSFDELNEKIQEIVRQIDFINISIETGKNKISEKKMYRDKIHSEFQALLNLLDKAPLKKILMSFSYHQDINFNSSIKTKEFALYPSLYQDIEDIRLTKKQIAASIRIWDRAAQDQNIVQSLKARLLEMQTRINYIDRDIANINQNITRSQNALIAIIQNTGTLQDSFDNPIKKLNQIGLKSNYKKIINKDKNKKTRLKNGIINQYQLIPEISNETVISYKSIMETVLGDTINATSSESIDDAISPILEQTLPQFKKINFKIKKRKLEKQYVLNQNLPQINLKAQYIAQGQAGRAVNSVQQPYVIGHYYGGYSDSFDNLLSNDLHTLRIGIEGFWQIRPPSIMFDKVRKQNKELLILQTKREKALAYIAQQLRYAYTEFETAYDQYKFASEQIKVLKKHVTIQEEIYKNRQNASLQDLLLYYDRVKNLYTARMNKVQAIENYQKAYAKLYRLSGLSLKRYNINKG
jgi:hypothetical protein